MAEVTPERLDKIEADCRIHESEYVLGRASSLAEVIAALRQAWAERDALATEADARRRALEDTLDTLADRNINGGSRVIAEETSFVWRICAEAKDALNTPRTRYTEIAAARRAVCEAVDNASGHWCNEGRREWFEVYGEDWHAIGAASLALAALEKGHGA